MTLTERLAQMEALLGEVPSAKGGTKVSVIAKYLEHCLEIDTILRSNPSAEDTAQIKAFMDKTAATVQDLAITFGSYGGEAVRVFMQQEFVGNDWVTLCLRRSHVEAFNDLYRDALPEDDLIDTEELDEDIRNKAELEAQPDPAQEPPDLPDSHWWWRLG